MVGTARGSTRRVIALCRNRVGKRSGHRGSEEPGATQKGDDSWVQERPTGKRTVEWEDNCVWVPGSGVDTTQLAAYILSKALPIVKAKLVRRVHGGREKALSDRRRARANPRVQARGP